MLLLAQNIVGKNEVGRISDLDVGGVTFDHEDRLVGQVAMHHSAVVGGDEARVAQSYLVCSFDSLVGKALRRLHIAQGRAQRDVADVSFVVDLDDGVGASYSHIDGIVVAECCKTVGYDALRGQWAHRVVSQEPVAI